MRLVSLDQIESVPVTHKYRDHECVIDRIFTNQDTSAYAFQDPWLSNSGHAVIACVTNMEGKRRKQFTTDWQAVKDWARDNEEEGEERLLRYGEAYGCIRELICSAR